MAYEEKFVIDIVISDDSLAKEGERLSKSFSVDPDKMTKGIKDAIDEINKKAKESGGIQLADQSKLNQLKTSLKEVESAYESQVKTKQSIVNIDKQLDTIEGKLATGQINYSKAIKDSREETERLYQKKQALIKANQQESEEFKKVEQTLTKSIEITAKLEDEYNGLKNTVDSVRQVMTPLQRDLKQAEQGVDSLGDTTKTAATEMREYIEGLDSAAEAAMAFDAKQKQVVRLLEETGAKLKEGDAEFSAYEDRMKAVAQAMLEMEKAGESNTASYKKLGAEYKELAKSAHEYKILEEQVASAAEGSVAKFDQLSTSFANIGTIASNIGGDLGNLMGSFGGLGSAITALPAQFDAIAKSGAKGFSAMLQNVTAVAATVGPAVIMAVQAIDQMITAQETATIEAGKAATAQKQAADSFKLSGQGIEDQVALIDEYRESNSELANKLMATAGNVEKFNEVLDMANQKILKTRELGKAQEWDTKETGGGLLGWVKKLGTDLEKIYANAGKAQVALEDMNSVSGKLVSGFSTIGSAITDAVVAEQQKLLNLNIQLLEAEGKKNEAQKLRMQMLKNEQDAALQAHKDKIAQLVKERAEYMRSVSELGNSISRLTSDIFNKTTMGLGYAVDQFATKHARLWATLAGIDPGNQEALRAEAEKFRKAYDDVMQLVADGSIKSAKRAIAEIRNIVGYDITEDMGKQIAERLGLKKDSQAYRTLMQGMAGWQTEVREAIEASVTFQQPFKQGQGMADYFQKEIDKLEGQTGEIKNIQAQVAALTQTLWELANKPAPTAGNNNVLDFMDNWDFTDLIEKLKSGAKMTYDELEKIINDLEAEMKNTNSSVYEGLMNEYAIAQRKVMKEIIKLASEMQLALQASIKDIVNAGATFNEQFISNYNTAKDTLDKLNDKRTDQQKEADAFKETLSDINKYYDQQIQLLIATGMYSADNLSAIEAQRREALALAQDTKDINDQIKIQTQEQTKLNEQIAKTKELWDNITNAITNAQDTHMKWLEIFDPEGYKTALKEINTIKLQSDIEATMAGETAIMSALDQGGLTSEIQAKLIEKFGLKKVMELNGKQLWEQKELIHSWFEALRGELTDLSNGAGVATKDLSGLRKELNALKQSNATWFPDFDEKEFERQLNEAMGIMESTSDKIKRTLQESLDDILEQEVNAKMSIQKTFDEEVKGLDENSEEYKTKREKLNQDLLNLDHIYAQKRIDVQKKAAIDAAAAWKTEYDKLQSMLDAYDKRIKDREKQTGDARIEIADYVRRSKMTAAEREADDKAKQLATDYERLLKSGLTENELTEWLALKRKEILGTASKEEIALFDKYWAERRQQAIDSAKIENQAWDDQTAKQRNEIDKQTKMVDALRQIAIDTKKILMDMLGLAPEVTDKYKEITVKPQPDATKLINGTPPPNSSTAPSALPHGTIYREGMELPAGVPRPGKLQSGALYWKWNATNGNWYQVWPDGVTAPAAGEPAPTPKASEFQPLETSQEIKDRTEAWKELEKVSKGVLDNMKTWIKTFDEALKASFEWFKPDNKKDWVKELINAWAGVGTDIVKVLTKPIREQLDPQYAGRGDTLIHMATQWGQDFMSAWVEGIDRGASLFKDGLVKSLKKIGVLFESHSPPTEGPFHLIDKYGYNAGHIYVENMASGIIDSQPLVLEGVDLLSKTLYDGMKDVGKQAGQGVKEGWQSAGILDTIAGLTVPTGTTGAETMEALARKLRTGKGVEPLYQSREKFYASTDTEYNTLQEALNIRSGSSRNDSSASFFSSYGSMTQDKLVDVFWNTWSKELQVVDAGEMTLEMLAKMIQKHPDWKAYYPLQRKLAEQYPELLKEAFAQGILSPVKAEKILDENGKVIGWKQTGNAFDKYSMDNLEMAVSKDTLGFNDYLQTRFNDFRLGKTNEAVRGYEAGDWYDSMSAFLHDYDKDRLARLVKDYAQYVTDKDGTVKNTQERLADLMKSGAGTSLVENLKSMNLDESIVYSDLGKMLGMDTEYANTVYDKQVVSGGAFYDKNGKELPGMVRLMKGFAAGEGRRGISATDLEMLLRYTNNSLGDKAATFTNKMSEIMGKGWEWASFKLGDTTIQAPYNVMTNAAAELLNRAGYDITPMSYTDAVRIYGEDAVKRFIETNTWPYILVSANRGNVAGDFSDIEASVASELQRLQTDILTKFGTKAGSGNFTEGDQFAGLTYKNKYTTVKGDTAYGVQTISKYLGGLDSTNRETLLDAWAKKVDEMYKDTYVTGSMSDGVESYTTSDQVPSGEEGTRNLLVSSDELRKKMKIAMAKLMGLSDEYSIARGWAALGETANVDKVAYEEILKNIDFLEDELKNQGWVQQSDKWVPGASETFDEGFGTNQTAVSEIGKFLDQLMSDGGNRLNEGQLKGVREAISYGLQSGRLTEDQAAALIDRIVPMETPNELIGLPSYDKNQALLQGAFGVSADSGQGVIGNRWYVPDQWANNTQQFGYTGYQDYWKPTNPYDYYQALGYRPNAMPGMLSPLIPYDPNTGKAVDTQTGTLLPIEQNHTTTTAGVIYVTINFDRTTINGVEDLENALISGVSKAFKQEVVRQGVNL